MLNQLQRGDFIMSCKSAIYTANTTPTTITLTTAQPTAVLPLGTVVRRFGKNIQLSGNGILLNGEGYYEDNTSVTLTPVTAGDYTVALFRDGVAIPGARQTVTATAGASITFNIPAIVRLQCCDSSATIQAVVSTAATLPATISVGNVGVTVEKL
jgi:hypothetical protein